LRFLFFDSAFVGLPLKPGRALYFQFFCFCFLFCSRWFAPQAGAGSSFLAKRKEAKIRQGSAFGIRSGNGSWQLSFSATRKALH
jgi:hypothetical protein